MGTTRGLSDHALVYTCIPFQLCSSDSYFSSSSASILCDSSITTTTTRHTQATPPHTTTPGVTADHLEANLANQPATSTAHAQ